MNYTLIRSRRRTIAIQITPAGEVILRSPSRMTKGEAEAFLRSKEAWVRKNLQKIPPAQPKLTPEEIDCLIHQARELLPERAAFFGKQLGVSYGRITIRSQRTRWGSCSARGNLNFNCLLMLCPPQVQDYVVVHELCHRKELNHSRAFWTLVEQMLPDYQTQRAWLKEQGNALIARLPEQCDACGIQQ